MTYDERREISEYLNIVVMNCKRLMHSVELLQDCIGEMDCSFEQNKKETKESKEDFLKHY